MIQIKGLRYVYPRAANAAVDKLSFSVERGEVFGFLGPSGAGKSTTQKILIGLLRAYEGSISVFEKDLAQWGPDYYERIGVSFEFPNHYLKLTAIENLTYFSALYSRATRPPAALLEMVGLEGDGELLVSQYSKGMKSRLGVARALLHDPELLFMDEPTAGLDPMNARRIVQLIQSQQDAGKTVFLTTHDMAVAEHLCDRVAFIVEGEIKLIGAPKTLKLSHGERRVRVEYKAGTQLAESEFPLEGLGQDRRFMALLQEHEIQTIHTLEATLDDIFIEVTGRGLT